MDESATSGLHAPMWNTRWLLLSLEDSSERVTESIPNEDLEWSNVP